MRAAFTPVKSLTCNYVILVFHFRRSTHRAAGKIDMECPGTVRPARGVAS